MKVTHGSWNAHHMTTILILARYSKRKSMQPLKFHLSSVWFTFLRQNGKTISYGNLSLTFQLHRCPIFWWRNMVKSPFWWVILRPTLSDGKPERTFVHGKPMQTLDVAWKISWPGMMGSRMPLHIDWLRRYTKMVGHKKKHVGPPPKKKTITPKRNPAFVLINNYCGFSRCP